MKYYTFLIIVLFSGCTISPVHPPFHPSTYTDNHKIPYDPELPSGGAAQNERGFDVKESPYFASFDFYTMKSTQTLTLLENFRTIQQMTDVTCGPVCAAMVLDYYGKKGIYNEKELQTLRGTSQDTTYLKHLITIFDTIGGFEYTSTYDYSDPGEITPGLIRDFLSKGYPIIIGTNEWGGHWEIIIGYDTMGTESEEDDILIVADPYDTTDHNQDGYRIYSLEHFRHTLWSTSYDPDYKWGLFLAVWPV